MKERSGVHHEVSSWSWKASFSETSHRERKRKTKEQPPGRSLGWQSSCNTLLSRKTWTWADQGGGQGPWFLGVGGSSPLFFSISSEGKMSLWGSFTISEKNWEPENLRIYLSTKPAWYLPVISSYAFCEGSWPGLHSRTSRPHT